MALDKVTLKATLISIFSNPATTNNVEQVAEQLSEAIDTYVKSGIVTGVCPPNGGALQAGQIE